MSRNSSRSSSPDVNRQPPKSSLKELQEDSLQLLLRICAIDPSEIRTQMMQTLSKEELSTGELILVSQFFEIFKTLFIKPKDEINVFLQVLNDLDEEEGLPDFDEKFLRLNSLVAMLKLQSSLLICEALLRLQHQKDEVLAYSLLVSDQKVEFSRLQTECSERDLLHDFEFNLDYGQRDIWRSNNVPTFPFFSYLIDQPEEKNQSCTGNTFKS